MTGTVMSVRDADRDPINDNLGGVRTSSVASVLGAVARVRLALDLMAWARALLIGVGVAGALWVIALVGLQRMLPRSAPVVATFGLMVAGMTILARVRIGRIGSLRAALWMEERRPVGFALVTLVERVSVERSAGADPGEMSRTNGGLVRAISAVPEGLSEDRRGQRVALASAALQLLRGPALFVAGLGLVTLVASRVRRSVEMSPSVRGANDTGGTSDAAIGRWRVRVVPPAYTGRAAIDVGDASAVPALSGSRLEVTGSGAELPEFRMRSLVRSRDAGGPGLASSVSPSLSSATAREFGGGWTATVVATADPAELRVIRASASRLLLVDGYADSVPRVELRLPVRDSVLRRATGALRLEAVLHDDINLASAAFELIVSSGEGEQFTARTLRVAATRFGRVRDSALRAELNLDSLRLGPGDIVHIRAVARDGHPAADRELGASETRSFRVAKASEYDSVAVEAAPPPEFDKSLLSQRMLLLLTEKLEARRSRIKRQVVLTESGTLARDQARLRLAVGDIVFQRLGGESDAEHAHGADGTGPPTGKIDVGMLEEGDDSPVIAINRPLLEAYNAMWDAGRALEQGDTKGAIPHMRLAVAAIERSRAASRLYLRGKPPNVLVDVARVRLAGRDTGTTNARTPRSPMSAPNTAREIRLLAAASLVGNDAAAARDSLAVLRLESLADAPDFARALESLSAQLARGGDLTSDFTRARRALGGLVRVPSGDWSRTGPP